MALAGIDALRVLQQFGSSDEQIRRRYLSQNHVLNDIRSDVYVSGTYVRDYLLEPDRRGRKRTGPAWKTFESTWSPRSNLTAAKHAPAEVQHYSALRSRANGLLGNSGSHLSMGSRRKGAVRDTPFCGTRFSRGGRTCSRSPTGSRRSTNSS